MNMLSASLLAALFHTAGASSSNPSQFVSNPHKYFTKQIQYKVDVANSVSTESIPYPADKYPSIDIKSWIHPDSFTDKEREEVVLQVLYEATSAGSFNIVGHGISAELLERLETSTQKFFSQDIKLKRNLSSENPKSGYVANQEEKYGTTVFETNNPYEQKGDIRELFTMVYPPNFSSNVQGPVYFQGAMNEYIERLQPVEVVLSKIFTAALNLARGIDLPLTYLRDADGVESTGALRAIRYPAMPSEYDTASRLLPHSDFGTLTILYGAEKGLEEIRDGRWVQVPMNKEKGELHVSVGQVYTMWSNELFVGNIHRVGHEVAKDRISLAYFVGQGQEGEGRGIEPVCVGGIAKFPRTSTAIHVGNYIEAMVNGEGVL